ncbi:MAG: LysR family transcriptional regulator [Oligoflexus sp.]
MNLTFLRNFLCFTEHMSIAAAARELKLSPSTVFVQLQQLQKMVGKDLYYQSSEGLKLTSAGQELAKLQREISEMTHDFETQVVCDARPTSLIFASNANLMLSWIRPSLTTLLNQGMTLHLRTYEWAMAQEHLLDGKVHLALGECFHVPTDLVFTPLMECHYCLFGTDDMALSDITELEVQELAGLSLVLPSPSIEWRNQLDEVSKVLGVDLRISAEVDVADLSIQLVQEGLGYGILPSYCPLPAEFHSWPIKGLPKMQVGWLERPQAIRRRVLVHFKEEVARHVRSL